MYYKFVSSALCVRVKPKALLIFTKIKKGSCKVESNAHPLRRKDYTQES
jgi:hypothetical protein